MYSTFFYAQKSPNGSSLTILSVVFPFQQERAPPHFRPEVRKYLNKTTTRLSTESEQRNAISNTSDPLCHRNWHRETFLQAAAWRSHICVTIVKKKKMPELGSRITDDDASVARIILAIIWKERRLRIDWPNCCVNCLGRIEGTRLSGMFQRLDADLYMFH